MLDATAHPQPLLRRPVELLDGTWDFALDVDGAAPRPDLALFEDEIVVPYAPETPASGLGIGGPIPRCWYRRRVRAEPGDGRVLLHFGAVDRDAVVWVNGAPVGSHRGGYTPFAVDVTDHLVDGETEIAVEVEDDPRDLEAPRGKQDWRDEPHAIWYPRTTGIWRSVWLERVPTGAIAAVDLTGDPSAMTVRAEIRLRGPRPVGSRVHLRLEVDGAVLAEDTYAAEADVAVRTLAIGDGGIDDRTALVWRPRHPVLIDAEVALADASGVVFDEVTSYTALRSVEVADGRILLNGRPYFLRLALDQGYWPESGATPPGTEALRRDLELTRALGFNGVRKHQKTEDPRFFAMADRMGLVCWAEMPSAYRWSTTTARRLLDEWPGVVAAHRGHPSVIAWVPMNESWGVPQVEDDGRQRFLVDALAAAAMAIDGTRPVSPNDGWETAGGGIVGIHDYTHDAAVLASRYRTPGAVDELLGGRRWDGRLADLDRAVAGRRAVVLSEFGGIALAADADGGNWGYTEASSPDDLLRRYAEQWAAVHGSDALAGACWTQLTDTYQEVNGLLRADRTPKGPLEEFARATRGR